MQLHLEADSSTSPPSLPKPPPVQQLPVSLGKYSVHLVHRSLLWLKQFLVCCFGQCGLLSFVRGSLCLEIAFPLEERQAKGSNKKKKKRGKRKTGRNNKEEPKVHREHTQPGEARHGTARHGDTAHFLSAAATRASFCQGLLAILQCLCATHTQPRLCLC